MDRLLCHELLRMLSSLGIYESSFQGPFLEDSRNFYELEGLSRMQGSDMPGYLLHCEVEFLFSIEFAKGDRKRGWRSIRHAVCSLKQLVIASKLHSKLKSE